MAPDDGELFAVSGVVEIADEFRFAPSTLTGRVRLISNESAQVLIQKELLHVRTQPPA